MDLRGQQSASVGEISVIGIEPEDPVKENPCATCNGTNRLLHGYIYDDEYARGVYFLEWCDGGHPDKAAFLTIGLGVFDEGSGTSVRNSVCIEWRHEGMRLTDVPARDRPELLGAFLPRAAALRLPQIDLLWHIADHVVLDDPRVSDVERWLKHMERREVDYPAHA